jgi:hypothetical protein
MKKQVAISDTDIRKAMYEMMVKKGVIIVTANDIAEEMRCSATTVHRIMRKHYGAVPGTTCVNSMDRKIRWALDRPYLAEQLAKLHRENSELRNELSKLK